MYPITKKVHVYVNHYDGQYYAFHGFSSHGWVIVNSMLDELNDALLDGLAEHMAYTEDTYVQFEVEFRINHCEVVEVVEQNNDRTYQDRRKQHEGKDGWKIPTRLVHDRAERPGAAV